MVEEQPAPDASAPSRTGAIAVKCRSLFKPMILIRRSSPRASFIKSSASRSQESDQCTAATTAGFSCAGYMPRPTLGTIDAHLPLARRGKVNVVEASPEGIPHRACAMGVGSAKTLALINRCRQCGRGFGRAAGCGPSVGPKTRSRHRAGRNEPSAPSVSGDFVDS